MAQSLKRQCLRPKNPQRKVNNKAESRASFHAPDTCECVKPFERYENIFTSRTRFPDYVNSFSEDPSWKRFDISCDQSMEWNNLKHTRSLFKAEPFQTWIIHRELMLNWCWKKSANRWKTFSFTSNGWKTEKVEQISSKCITASFTEKTLDAPITV